MLGDTVAEFKESQDGRALLEPVMRDGVRLTSSPALSLVRERAAAELAALPESMRDPLIDSASQVQISASLQALAARIDRSAY